MPVKVVGDAAENRAVRTRTVSINMRSIMSSIASRVTSAPSAIRATDDKEATLNDLVSPST